MNRREKIRSYLGMFLLSILFSLPFMPQVQTFLTLPNAIVTTNSDVIADLAEKSEAVTVLKSKESSIQAISDSEFYVYEDEQSVVHEYKGIPVKKTNVEILDDLEVVPGGQSLGIQLHTSGVLVVGHYLVDDGEQETSPGEKADVKVGDIILSINDKKVEEIKDVKPIVEQASKEEKALNLTVKRGEKEFDTTLQPIKDKKNDEYQIGLYIRDSAAGIGTMTFHDPQSKRYGALGHVISDMDTKKPIEISNGLIVNSSVTSIEKGNNGSPGEKQARFSVEDSHIGSITKNSPFGVFGKLNESIQNGKYDQPMPIALSHEVKEGPAKILTVIEGEKVEEFSVEITSSVPQKFPATKGMVVKVTDPDLLEATGGIVQGMSGSPIIQDGKMIGAVTHVFVNDPTSGYGVHIEWMLDEAGINIYKDENKKAS